MKETSKLARLLMEAVADPVGGRFSDWDDFATTRARYVLYGSEITPRQRTFRLSLQFHAQYILNEDVAGDTRVDPDRTMRRVVCQRMVREIHGDTIKKIDRLLSDVAGGCSRRDAINALVDLRDSLREV